MRAIVNGLLFVALAGCCLIVLADSSLGQQEQIPGTSLDAKRSADLPFDPANQPRPTAINIDKVKEFDRVSGICLDEDESVVAGASVQVYRKTTGRDEKKAIEEPVASAETGSDGKFAFENLQTQFPTNKFDSNYILVVRKKGYATKFLSSLSWETGEQLVKLSNRAMVKGVIRNDLAQPVSDAAVSFYHPLKESFPDVYATRTDGEGKFQIGDYHTVNSAAHNVDGKMRGSIAFPLNVSHPDYGSVSFMIERTPNLFLITISRGARFAGRIVDEQGEPVADCRISMQSHTQEPMIWAETTSNKDGKFQIAKLPDIRINLFFKTDDLIGPAIELSGSPGSETNLGELKLVKPIVIQGVVIDDETDEPLKLKESLMYSIGWHGPERPNTSAIISGTEIQADGTFECRFLPGLNYPYVSSGYLQMIDQPYKDGIEITAQSRQKLEFRVRHGKMDDEQN